MRVLQNDLVTALRDGSLWRGSLLLLCLLLVLVNLALARWQAALEKERSANLLIESASHSIAGARYDRSVGERPLDFWPAIPDARKQSLVILAGMSQMYAINDPVPGDRTISEWLDDRFAPEGVRVFGLAAPNLSNEEALYLLTATASEPRTRPSTFVFGMCFDKFRNVDLRPGYLAMLRESPAIRHEWAAIAERYSSRYPLATAKMRATLSQATERAAVTDSSFEMRLREAVGRAVPLVGMRQALNATVQGRLYLMRNAVFHITPTSKRPIIRIRYDMNRQFVQLMADVAKERGSRFATYVIPLNPRAENPYVAAEYDGFKVWSESFANEAAVPFANFENIIPSELWGTFNGGPDFKHFRGAGHRMTAAAIGDRFGTLFRQPFSAPLASVKQ